MNSSRKAIQEEHIWVPHALRVRASQLRSRAEGNVLHIGTDDADAAEDDSSSARYDTICSLGALAMSENLPRLAEKLHSRLATDGRLLFLEPEAPNPDITITLWNCGFAVLQVERFSVSGTAPVGSRWWRKGRRTIWHNCVSGVGSRKLEDSQPEEQP